MTARLGGVDDDDTQLDVTEEAMLASPLADLAEIAEPEEYFGRTSRIDANTLIDRGNTDSQTVRVNGSTGLEPGDHRRVAALTLADESLERFSAKEQRRLTYCYGRLIRFS